MRTNINGGAPCTIREAPGYSKKLLANGRFLVSGIYSVAATWQGFEYDEASIGMCEAATAKPREYKPIGLITQLPACSNDYKGKNSAGGRKTLSGYIGAAYRVPQNWETGISSPADVQVRMCIDHREVALGPEADLTWLALRLRRHLVEKLQFPTEYRMAA